MPACHDCGTTVGVASYHLCAPCFLRYVRKLRTDAGLPVKSDRVNAAFAAALDAQDGHHYAASA